MLTQTQTEVNKGCALGEPAGADWAGAGSLRATCPACGHTGPEAIDFSYLPDDSGDVDRLECVLCGHQFDADEQPRQVEAGAECARVSIPGWLRDRILELYHFPKGAQER